MVQPLHGGVFSSGAEPASAVFRGGHTRRVRKVWLPSGLHTEVPSHEQAQSCDDNVPSPRAEEDAADGPGDDGPRGYEHDAGLSRGTVYVFRCRAGRSHGHRRSWCVRCWRRSGWRGNVNQWLYERRSGSRLWSRSAKFTRHGEWLHIGKRHAAQPQRPLCRREHRHHWQWQAWFEPWTSGTRQQNRCYWRFCCSGCLATADGHAGARRARRAHEKCLRSNYGWNASNWRRSTLATAGHAGSAIATDFGARLGYCSHRRNGSHTATLGGARCFFIQTNGWRDISGVHHISREARQSSTGWHCWWCAWQQYFLFG
mmetsp:Transcript_134742/g.234176  ORF Transcript_134742/g.234176 Transcript_134742/m.234176 type:complete len:314 (-) Transcript_134742:643-1584(-)